MRTLIAFSNTVEPSYFDIVIVGLSCESRSLAVAKEIQPRSRFRIAVPTSSSKDFSYKENETWLLNNGHSIYDVAKCVQLVRSLIKAESNQSAAALRILLDISTMSRPTIADLFSAALCHAANRMVELSIVYSIAIFSEPPVEVAPNDSIAPVSPDFAGWPTVQAAATSVVIGLGYEPSKGEGATEFLEPAETWAFVPASPLPEYRQRVEENNKNFLTRLARDNRVLQYSLIDPSATFGQLEVLISSLRRETNPILLPFGPKLFFALALLQGYLHPEIGVWHVTGEAFEVASDKKASGHTVEFSALFRTGMSESDPL